MSCSGTIGKITIVPPNFRAGVINQALLRIRLKTDLDQTYFRIIFSFIISKLIEGNELAYGGVIKNIASIKDLKSIKIPIPKIGIQRKICKILLNAEDLKAKKQKKAQQLVDEIDGFIIKQLDLNIEPNKESKKIFTIKFSELENRLDPLFYSTKILKAIEESKHKKITIGDLSNYMKSGFAAGKHQQIENDNSPIQIRPTNLNKQGELYFKKNIHICDELYNQKINEKLNKGEVLFNNTNSQEWVGKTAVFNLDGTFFCSNHITRISVNKNLIYNYYLWAILNFYQSQKVFFTICTNWNNQSGVNNKLLASIPIPIVDFQEQKKIAKEVIDRLNLRNKLLKEAETDFQKAKYQVEQIILGN